jgi:hypothetical protein
VAKLTYFGTRVNNQHYIHDVIKQRLILGMRATIPFRIIRLPVYVQVSESHNVKLNIRMDLKRFFFPRDALCCRFCLFEKEVMTKRERERERRRNRRFVKIK